MRIAAYWAVLIGGAALAIAIDRVGPAFFIGAVTAIAARMVKGDA